MRARPLWQRPVTYGAIGGTKADDLLAHPPAGFRPLVRRRRIGHGQARFAWASSQVMTWGVQRLSGFGVDLVDAPDAATDGGYVPVTFDPDGVPVEPTARPTSGERHFGEDGRPFLRPGDTAVLTIRFLGIPVAAPVRIVYVVDEPDRQGFGYGTLKGHPERGEESFVVERHTDGSVWFTLSAFSRPSTWYWHVLFIPLRVAQSLYTRRYLAVLAGPTGRRRDRSAPAPAPAPETEG